ncbi:MAG: DUF4956 domain-containing protein [Planctomycetota bacterium]
MTLLEAPSWLESNDTMLAGALAVAGRLVLAGVLGAGIAVLYSRARGGSEQSPGLRPTLVLLAMLITLVTLAVGTNVAVAFTLVGTLAIVRFRTTVSDVRDTAFVIFSVAVGIAAGQSVEIAIAGAIVIGVAVEILRMTGMLGAENENEAAFGGSRGTLQLTIAPPLADPSLYEPVLERFGVEQRVLGSRVDRDRNRLRLTLRVGPVSPNDAATITSALLERPEVVEANLELE